MLYGCAGLLYDWDTCRRRASDDVFDSLATTSLCYLPDRLSIPNPKSRPCCTCATTMQHGWVQPDAEQTPGAGGSCSQRNATTAVNHESALVRKLFKVLRVDEFKVLLGCPHAHASLRHGGEGIGAV